MTETISTADEVRRHINAAMTALEPLVLAGLIDETGHREVWERLEDAAIALDEAST